MLERNGFLFTGEVEQEQEGGKQRGARGDELNQEQF